MFVIALVVGALLAIILIIAGVSTKKVILSVLGAIIGVFVFGYITILILVNSPFWPM